MSPVKKLPDSPEKKKRKTKAELKEELTKQKVMEKKAALRRQRTRNKRWAMVNFCKRCIRDTEKEMGIFVYILVYPSAGKLICRDCNVLAFWGFQGWK